MRGRAILRQRELKPVRRGAGEVMDVGGPLAGYALSRLTVHVAGRAAVFDCVFPCLGFGFAWSAV